MDILYILECAPVLARKHKRHLLAYLITMAMIEAGGGLMEPPPYNDNRTD
jgi:hypothetical protein